MSIDVMRAYLDCRLTCCRFRTPKDRTEWAREHSPRTRVSEAADLSGLAPSMRASRQVDVLQAARASMVTVNSSLQGNGFESLPVEHVENQLAALQRIMARHTAAQAGRTRALRGMLRERWAAFGPHEVEKHPELNRSDQQRLRLRPPGQRSFSPCFA
jgi:hypothetical protein